jgi:hypothetical protein
MTIDDLVQQIEETERLIVVYRNADEVVVGTQDQIYSRRGLINRTIFTAAEIDDAGTAQRTRWQRPRARPIISRAGWMDEVDDALSISAKVEL